MKKSTVFSVIGLVLAISGLLIGLQSIGADSWEQLGIIFILPSFLAFIIIVFDLLVTVGKIKRGLIYLPTLREKSSASKTTKGE